MYGGDFPDDSAAMKAAGWRPPPISRSPPISSITHPASGVGAGHELRSLARIEDSAHARAEGLMLPLGAPSSPTHHPTKAAGLDVALTRTHRGNPIPPIPLVCEQKRSSTIEDSDCWRALFSPFRTRPSATGALCPLFFHLFALARRNPGPSNNLPLHRSHDGGRTVHTTYPLFNRKFKGPQFTSLHSSSFLCLGMMMLIALPLLSVNSRLFSTESQRPSSARQVSLWPRRHRRSA